MSFLVSQWSDVAAMRWTLRLLPLAALVTILCLPAERRGRLRLPLPMLLFGGWCLLSVLWTSDQANSVRRCVDVFALLTVGWVVGQVLGLPAARHVLALAVRGVLLASVVVLVVLPDWSTTPGADGAPGWHGLFPHKNGLGFFCAVAFVTLYCDTSAGWRRRLWLALCAIVVVGSQSASALGATAAAGCVIGWHALRGERPDDRRRLRTDVMAAAALLIAVLCIVARPGLGLELLGRDSSLTGRREIWTAVIRQIGERPIEGYGFGGVWDRASPVTLEIWRESRFEAFYAHNGYLDLPLQVGFVGLGLFLVLVVSLVLRALGHRPYAEAAWPLGLLAVLLITAFTESSPFTGEGLLLLALLGGFLTPPAVPDGRSPLRTARRSPAVAGASSAGPVAVGSGAGRAEQR
ncbi:O-antigen ligase family protein [Blastococcus sp. VKM Ac-2987]|uniref:O-antigen ligase family protein n=1 Tax=Blastococcus sp. VKM Ac-2987 TaxID=3004141 RepID=UPI0022AB6C81|nr:O-antigen ligase family protein [Blastococcus sp. VKM Ac-2987]MCZ2858470.1 O-antigen ligase family protein [Blastococcus sp. VKM Ac-2987]